MMRNLIVFLLGILSLVAVCSCGNEEYPKELCLAENFLEKAPRKSLRLLDGYGKEIGHQSNYVQMYYYLLRIKAKDKLYQPLTEDSLIFRVVDYYEHHDRDKTKLSDAYFYAGRFCFDNNNAPQALSYFEKSLNALRELDDKNRKGLIHGQIGYIFLYQHLFDNALSEFKEALKFDELSGDKRGIIFDVGDIADVYCSKNMQDSALLFYKKAYSLAKEERDTLLIPELESQLARVYKDLGKLDSALFYVWKMNKGQNNSLGGKDAIAADTYMRVGKTDSAK
ncbi:MAG: tetratricopeptide repeat protein [Prevotella sp.]|nr:tetratricopeptide repeat protein [Prevotella sp.]